MALLATIKLASGGTVQKIKETTWAYAYTMLQSGEEMVYCKEVPMNYFQEGVSLTTVYILSDNVTTYYGVGGTSYSSFLSYITGGFETIFYTLVKTDITYLT